ncbi:DUF1707 SHOCT-like domain-containing protein [Nocardioides kribbensis]|uniref:DUF1707 domain-containing protein n=1 Tax=Nocardioides kribbensis TaxID=305517 RepID=A0ABV1P1Q6_9ACTN
MSDQLRIGDAEREQASAYLAAMYARGMLTAEEHSDRVGRIWAATTRGDLVPLFADLPGPHQQPGWAVHAPAAAVPGPPPAYPPVVGGPAPTPYGPVRSGTSLTTWLVLAVSGAGVFLSLTQGRRWFLVTLVVVALLVLRPRRPRS